MTTPAHRAQRRERSRPSSARVRALLALGSVAAVAAGLSAHGTFAAWSDSATVQTGSFASGSLDITVNDQLVGGAGSWTSSSLALAEMQPGESVAVSFPVRNNGSTPLVYSVSGTATGALAVSNGLRFSVTFGVPAVNSGSRAAGNRTGSCGTAASEAGTTPLTPASTSLTGSRPLAVGVAETACVVARLSSSAPNSLQGASGSAALVFAAVQPTAG